MFRKTLLTSALAAASLGATAAEFYVVVALPGKQVPLTDISVSLNTFTLPPAKVNTPYAGFDFKAVLTVTGDPSFTADQATFNATSSLPAGLSLSSSGVLSGTPKVVNAAGTTIQVLASYKTKSGQQAYTIIVNDTVLRGVTQIATGSNHACAVVFGGVKCWGRNDYGAVGDGTWTHRATPTNVIGLTSGVVKVMTANDYSCAVTTSGAAKCWGRNDFGFLGDGTTTTQNTPVAVSGLSSGVVAMDGGEGTTCALLNTGGVKCWGWNLYGTIGDGTTTNRLTPVDVSGLTSGASQLTVGQRHACVLLASGAAKCWGLNDQGQLGDGTTTDRLTPVEVSGLPNAVSLSGGGYHTCAVTTAGAVKCWGGNWIGQLGDGTTTNRATPVAVSGLESSVASVAGGGEYTCAVTTAGAAKCWGYNYYGNLGDGSQGNSRLTPIDVLGLSSGVAYISAGGSYLTCAVMTDSAAKCWGYNYGGSLGNGIPWGPSSQPVAVLP